VGYDIVSRQLTRDQDGAYSRSVRLTDFWQRMDERFGAAYAHSLAKDYRLSALGATIDEAVEAGVETREIWRAVCAEFEMPASLR
jgi:hypothetical protein